MAAGGFVAYYRVSTAKQGASGLGLEAQQAAVSSYLNGGEWRIVGAFTEVESGKSSDRPELAKALAAARLHRAPLVVANVSRLTRSLAFLSKLLEAGVAGLHRASQPDGVFCYTFFKGVGNKQSG